MSAFEEFGVCPELIKAIDEMGWMLATPVQQEAIPLILGGGDVMAAAETGSGKTGAFGLPVLQIVHETLREDTSEAAPKTTATPAARMNGDDRDMMLSLAPDGLTAENRQDRAWAGGRATVAVSKGKYYYEVTMLGGGLGRVGWSTITAGYDLGTDKNGFGFGGTGKKSNNRQFDAYGDVFGQGDVVGCYIDLDGMEIYFTKNGVDLGKAFDIPPSFKNQGFFPAVCLKNNAVQLNFGATPFQFLSFEGFTGIHNANPSDVVAVAQGGDNDTSSFGPVAVIVEPSRDLAEQVYKELQMFKKYLTAPAVSVGLFVGGVDAGQQIKSLKQGVQIVVGTPGRLIDMMNSGKLSMKKVRFFVLDEADRLVDAENASMMQKLYSRIPKTATNTKRLQVLMFSATLHSPEITAFSETVCHFPTWVDLKGKDSVPETVHHLLVRIDPTLDTSWDAMRPAVPTDGVHARDGARPNNPSVESRSEGIKRLKCAALVRLIDTLKMDSCMIFCRTNLDCDNLEKYLTACGGGSSFRGKAEKGKENPYSCVVLAGMRAQDERRRNLQHFKDGDVRFLICTDVAARGIDIKELPFVINMTLPDASENYIHRIGRVGRAECMGLAISLVGTEKEKVWYHKCPNRGQGCSNTKLIDKGGCTIWYDEPALLKDVENRLKQSITVMGPDCQLPPEFSKIQYGVSKATNTATTSEHIQRLRPTAQQLASLEVQSQDLYHNLKQRWNKKPRAAA